MIRKFESRDLDAVMQIWLHSNLDAHAFIAASFWTEHFEMVRDLLPQAELYVHEDASTRQIDGFIGLTENHIEGIFVAKAARSKGIGKALLEYAKSRKPCLTPSVYQKNQRALAFYRREQFVVQSEGIDEDTNEAEIQMLWTR
ncbi:MAG: GNAT family N-acetyltransferase [Clostridiales bacterium]|nr:GNAT family N-acetyltransferase [Clostridiales bacterium]